MPIFYRFRDITTYWSKISLFHNFYPPLYCSLVWIRRKGFWDLGCQGSSKTLDSLHGQLVGKTAWSSEYLSSHGSGLWQTDRRTDRRHRLCLNRALAYSWTRKNEINKYSKIELLNAVRETETECYTRSSFGTAEYEDDSIQSIRRISSYCRRNEIACTLLHQADVVADQTCYWNDHVTRCYCCCCCCCNRWLIMDAGCDITT